MRICCISDTHGQHWNVQLPEADVLVHAGDLCSYGSMQELQDAAEFLKAQREYFNQVIAIGGNHDWPLMRTPDIAQRFMRDSGIIYLEDNAVSIEGKVFYGSPWTPTFLNWAFMKDRGTLIREMWDKIPENVDVLITHGPPYGVLDPAYGEPHGGCVDLLNRVTTVAPKLHVFGHLHRGFGTMEIDGTTFVNAAQLDDGYNLVNKPIVVEI